MNWIIFSLKSVLIAFFVITSMALSAQETNEELAKIAQNPLGNLLSFPFQNNTSFNYGPYDRVQDILNIQPIIPFFNGRLITRTIIPLQWPLGLRGTGKQPLVVCRQRRQDRCKPDADPVFYQLQHCKRALYHHGPDHYG